MIQLDCQIKQILLCLSKLNWRFKMAKKQILSTIVAAFIFSIGTFVHAAT